MSDETKKDDAATNDELKPVRVEPNAENEARPYPLPNLIGESNPERESEKREGATERLIEGAIVVEDGVKKVLRRRPPLLEIRDLSVIFGENQILRDINLKVRRGETVAVIGESGCGKTVLLKNMIGLIAPTSGSVLFKGKDLARVSDKKLTEIRTHYGFVFQMAALFDSMTIAENVAFPLRHIGAICGVPKSKSASKASSKRSGSTRESSRTKRRPKSPAGCASASGSLALSRWSRS